MSYNLPQAEEIRQGIRASICSTCYKRPKGIPLGNVDEVLVCERTCSIFLHQHRLSLIAYHIDPNEEDYEKEISKLICSQCLLNPNHSKTCVNRESGSCPLSVYGVDVLKLIDKIVKS